MGAEEGDIRLGSGGFNGAKALWVGRDDGVVGRAEVGEAAIAVEKVGAAGFGVKSDGVGGLAAVGKEAAKADQGHAVGVGEDFCDDDTDARPCKCARAEANANPRRLFSV